VRLGAIVDAVAGLPVPVLLLAHPRLVARAQEHGLVLDRGAIRLGRPLPYPQMVAAIMASTGVLTDSGGLQKEAFLLDRPCTTVRSETEWTETLDGGWNMLVDDLARLPEAVARVTPDGAKPTPFGDGAAARRVVRALQSGGPPDDSRQPDPNDHGSRVSGC
jgi:UDP-N-acetylglucosamine 2-epimerase (non-hydrolysing)